MSIKKILMLSAASMVAATGVSFAGGPDHMPPAEDSMFHPGVYMDLHGGYAFADYSQLVASTTTIWAMQQGMDNETGGGVGGVDLGLQVFNGVAAEVGGFYLPKVKGFANSVAPNYTSTARGCQSGENGFNGCVQAEQYNWVVYAAGKFGIPLTLPFVGDGLDLFAKVGGAWRGMSNTNQVAYGRGGMKSFWSMIFGAGAEYNLMETGFKVGAQWLYLPHHQPGYSSGDATSARTPGGFVNSKLIAARQPSANIITGSIGYIFDF